jgi:hypothetical protein
MVLGQAAGIEDGFDTARAGVNAGGGQLVALGDLDHIADGSGAVLGSDGRGLLEPAGGRALVRVLAHRLGHGQQVGVILLDAGDGLGGGDGALQGLGVKFVGTGPGSLLSDDRADGDHVVLIGHVLVDGVVSKAGQGRVPTGDQDLDLVGGRTLLNDIEDFRATFLIEHG